MALIWPNTDNVVLESPARHIFFNIYASSSRSTFYDKDVT